MTDEEETLNVGETFCYSFNGENFEGDADSRADAIDDALGEYPDKVEVGVKIHTGIAVPYVPVIDAENILDQLGNDAQEECGEFSEGWPQTVASERVRELGIQLTDVLNRWLAANAIAPSFFTIREIVEHVISQEEAARYV